MEQLLLDLTGQPKALPPMPMNCTFYKWSHQCFHGQMELKCCLVHLQKVLNLSKNKEYQVWGGNIYWMRYQSIAGHIFTHIFTMIHTCVKLMLPIHLLGWFWRQSIWTQEEHFALQWYWEKSVLGGLRVLVSHIFLPLIFFLNIWYFFIKHHR